MCYLGPTTAAIITTFMWKSKRTVKLFWLMLLFYGGALFGVIDHFWNGELFLVSENWAKDIMLGMVITLGIVVVWAGILVFTKRSPVLTAYITNAEKRL